MHQFMLAVVGLRWRNFTPDFVMDYKKFSKLSGVELKLLAALGVLTQRKLAFKINNHPNFDISHYDRHNMETYFFADEHPFPWDVSFIINVDKEGESIIADDELEDYKTEAAIDDDVEDGEEILSEFLTAKGEIPSSLDRIDGFELHGIEQPLVDNTGKTITFVGGYKAGYSGIDPEGWSVYAFCEVLGIDAFAAEDNMHLGILAEGLAMMLRKDYKLASFMFYCALESSSTTGSTLSQMSNDWQRS